MNTIRLKKKDVISSSSQRPCELFTVLGIPIHPSSMLHHKLFIFKSSPLKPLCKIETRLGCEGPCVVLFQNCVKQPCPPFNMASVIEKYPFT